MKKIIAPLIVTALFIIYFFVYFAVLIFVIPSLVAKIVLGIIPLAFASVMERFEKTLPPSKMLFSGIVGREPVSVKSKVKDIKNALNISGQLMFDDLFNEVKSRSEIVAIFLAVLEMVRNDSLVLSYTDEKIVLTEMHDS